MTITVRQATEHNLMALGTLYAELHPADPMLSHEQAMQTWQEIIGQAGRTLLIALREETAVGTVDSIVVPNLTRGGRPYMLVENVVVARSARRQGVAGRMFNALIDLARAVGCYKVQLLSHVDRCDAHRFYESRGLRPVAQGYRLYLD
ncbi:GNAT family N-acetyltransferase [Micromonospora sediminimaris]|uniref:GNAT family N-acetyltransferase n=1 Tax=Micromonospora sediminimaris TaxID=547162 RepID=UPI00379787A0